MYNQKNDTYRKWAETKFFDYTRIQECIGTEFGDNEWTINEYRLKQMDQDLSDSFAEDVSKIKMDDRKIRVSLAVDYKFTRKYPPDTKVTKGTTYKTLDINYYEDCQTAE